MTTLHFKVGEHIPTLGKIKAIYFESLFNFKYNIDDTLYEPKALINALAKRRQPIIERLIYLLKTNAGLAFKFLRVKILKYPDLETVNELIKVLNAIWNTIDAEDFNFNNYYDNETLEDLLIQFWRLYDKK